MENYENIITDIVNKKVHTPEQYNYAIRNAFISKSTSSRKSNLFKIPATAGIGIILLTNIVFAAYSVYQNIWKEPTKYDTEEGVLSTYPDSIISEEEKKNIISETEAKNVALNFLYNLGYNDKSIEKIELKRDYSQKLNSYYMVKTNTDYEKGLMILVNASNGKITYFNDVSLKYQDYKSDNITDEQAIEIAYKVYDMLNLPRDEFSIHDVKNETLTFQTHSRNIYCVKFYKNINGIPNNYETISVSFMSVENTIFYDTISINTDKDEITNPLVISKEKAIEIAKNKEQEFTDVEITNVEVEQSIEKMNTFVYQLENEIYNTDPLQEGTYLHIEDISRNVWKVLIQHDNKKEESYYNNYNEYMKENIDKYYYIDITTGEIIGGTTYR